jgi:hypothetical protein
MTILVIWVYVLYIATRGWLVGKSYYQIATVAQYEPPTNISPILAHYLLSFGSESKVASNLNNTNEQLLVLIYLYEHGLLSSLNISETDLVRVEYQISDNYISIPIAEEGKLFINYLVKQAGLNGILTEVRRGRDRRSSGVPNGFDVINKFWPVYWYKDLKTIANTQNIVNTKSKHYRFLQVFSPTLIFGSFFAVFAFMFSTIFTPLLFIGLLLIFPQVILFSLIFFLLKILISLGFDTTVLQAINLSGILSITFVSWFVWAFLLVISTKKLYFQFTTTGKTILQQLAGYKDYLKTVDLNRVDIESKTAGSKINSTTFPWLLALDIANYKHWQQWRGVMDQSTQSNSNLLS